MNRRTFLAALPAAVAGVALTDPSRLLAEAPIVMPVNMTGNPVFAVGDVVTFLGDPRRYVVTDVSPRDWHAHPVVTFIPAEDVPEPVSLMGESW